MIIKVDSSNENTHQKKMSQTSEMNVLMETQQTLNNIQAITQKIKQELTTINEMIRDKGDLTIAIEVANNKLVQTARELGIKSINELLVPSDDNDEGNLLNVASVDDITQKLMSIMDT